jgi:glutamate synthase (NADPH/NADH) small chain
MGNPKAFLTVPRKEAGYRPLSERIYDYGEVEQTLNSDDRREQASRCMDCGVPFCLWACPLGNCQPEWQEALRHGKWQQAYHILSATNDFPEFTGRICPALCEKACVLAISHNAVTIRENEAAVAEKMFLEGYIKPTPPATRNGKRVAIVGSGPSGLAAANRLNKSGFEVTVYEKDETVGGLLRLGIPDFKLNKKIIDRRIDIMKQEGIQFITGVEVGKDVAAAALTTDYDAVLLCIGAGTPRDINVEGRDLKGIHFALDYLRQQNRRLANSADSSAPITAHGKHVLVIGGGDTGSDCVGTAIRQGAVSVTQIEIMPEPPVGDNPATPWPAYPQILKTSSSHEEGCQRRWALDTRKFTGAGGEVAGAEVEAVEWKAASGGKSQPTHTGRCETLKADLVLLSMGFVHPVWEGLLSDLGVQANDRTNVAVHDGQLTSVDKVFAAGDAAMGASLVVRAIASGQRAAEDIERYCKVVSC